MGNAAGRIPTSVEAFPVILGSREPFTKLRTGSEPAGCFGSPVFISSIRKRDFPNSHLSVLRTDRLGKFLNIFEAFLYLSYIQERGLFLYDDTWLTVLCTYHTSMGFLIKPALQHRFFLIKSAFMRNARY